MKACNFNPKRLYDLLKHTELNQLRRFIQTYYDDQIFEIKNIAESINIDQIEQYDYQTVISILFYLGYLTIKPNYEQEQPNENLLLVCPNKFMRKFLENVSLNTFFMNKMIFLKISPLIWLVLNIMKMICLILLNPARDILKED